jgi:chromosome segregation ATPase
MKKLKSLRKRIRRLESRLQKSGNKLAKLKQKLGAAETAAATMKSKSAARGGRAGKKSAVAVKEPSAPKKVKRRLNLTPERREQLAETMRARWAAKRAAATSAQSNPSGQ